MFDFKSVRIQKGLNLYKDEEGYLFITGRKKNVIIAKNGKNVYPEEIETRLNRFEYVKECMVFGRVS